MKVYNFLSFVLRVSAQFPKSVIFLGIVLIRLVGLIVMQWHDIVPIAQEYEHAALNFLEGRGFYLDRYNTSKYSDFSPLYGFVSILVYYIFGHYQILMQICNAIFTAICGVYIFKLTNIFFKKACWLAVLAVALHPGIFYYDLFYLHPLSLDTLLFTAMLFYSFQLMNHNYSHENFILLGATFGLQMYERGTVILFIFFFMLILLRRVFVNADRPLSFKKLLWIPLLFMMLVLPWTVRNYIIHKQFIPMLAVTGELLWRGNNVKATGTSWGRQGNVMLEGNEVLRKEIFKLDEFGQKKRFEQEFFEDFLKDPERVFVLFLKKNFYFWWFSPWSGRAYSKLSLVIYKIYYILILLLALLGVGQLIRESRGLNYLKLVMLLGGSVSFMQSIFYVQAKHRWALEPSLLIMSAVGVVVLMRIFSRNKISNLNS